MRDFKDEYRIQADKYEIPREVLMQTKEKAMEFQKPRKHFTIKTILIAATLIICMCVSVFAYEYHQYKLTNNNSGRNHEYLNPGNESVQVVNKTAMGENISITLKEVKADEKGMYITVVLKTTDGSDLNISTEQCVPILERQGFESAYFIVDNQNIDFTTVFRTDDGSNITEAVFELAYYDSADLMRSLKGRDIKLVFENFQYEVTINESIDSIFSNMNALTEKVGLAEERDFSEVGIYITYANGNTISSYTLNAGNKKIYFSNKYSKTYIDNIGLYENGEMKNKQLYISIMPENDKVRDELLSNLALFNTETGEFVYAEQPYIGDSDGGYGIIKNEDGTTSVEGYDGRNVQPQDGRIVLIFNAGIDVYDEINERYGVDTTIELLKEFEFRLITSNKTETVKNTWNLIFNLENVNTALCYDVNKEIQKNGANVKIVKIEVSDSYFSIKGSAGAGFDFKTQGQINLILENGTKVDVGPKIAGGYEESTGEFSIEGNLETLVDINEVIAIELWNQTIELH